MPVGLLWPVMERLARMDPEAGITEFTTDGHGTRRMKGGAPVHTKVRWRGEDKDRAGHCPEIIQAWGCPPCSCL